MEPSYLPYELLSGNYERLLNNQLLPKYRKFHSEQYVRGWGEKIKQIHDFDITECAGLDCIKTGYKTVKLLCEYEDLEQSSTDVDLYYIDEDRLFENLFAVVMVCSECEKESKKLGSFHVKDTPCIIDDYED